MALCQVGAVCAFPTLTEIGWLDHEAFAAARLVVFVFLQLQSAGMQQRNLNTFGSKAEELCTSHGSWSHGPAAA